MDWADSPDESAFRKRVSTFIQQKLPSRYRAMLESGDGEGEDEEGRSAPGGSDPSIRVSRAPSHSDMSTNASGLPR